MRRLIKSRPDKYEIIVRSESVVEVLENILKRKLDYKSAADMGLLDQFTQLDDRLKGAPPSVKENVRKLWAKSIKKIHKIGVNNGISK